MSDIKKTHFYEEVIALLEEIEAMYEDSDFDIAEEYVDEDSENFEENDTLTRFIHHIRDAKKLAEENS